MKPVLISALFIAALSAPAWAQQQQPAPPDPQGMSREALIDELTDLRAIVQGGAVRPQRPGGCTSAEHRQLDFWLGEWDVSPSVSSSVIVAESSITAHDQGCIVMEHWRPLRSGHGHSMNVYDAADGAWHQMWVDSNGRRTAFRGNFADGIMRLDVTNAAAGAPRTRMSYRALDADTVRQWGEQFDPATNSWNTTWEFIYRRRAGTR